MPKRTKCLPIPVSQEINLATDQGSTSLVLAETMFPDNGVLAALWLGYSTAGVGHADLTNVKIGYKNVSGLRSTEEDDDYFVAACTKTLQEAKNDGAGFPFREFTLAHTDIVRGDVLTIKHDQVTNGGYVRLFGLWYKAGDATGVKAHVLPVKFKAATTSTA